MSRIILITLSIVVACICPAGADEQKSKPAEAIFAGGCFWCMEPPFEKLKGVSAVVSGYIGGEEENPTYRQVSSGRTGHTEAVRISYDPSQVSYEQLLEVFWKNIDPTQKNGQFCDRGSQYRPGIFYLNESQQAVAENSKASAKKMIKVPGEFHTEITKAGTFYPAEGYHQDYYKKNSLDYQAYRHGCGRDRRLAEIWGVQK